MVYNTRKTKREWARQACLAESWRHTHKRLLQMEKKCANISYTKFRNYIIRWCRQEIACLRKINAGLLRTPVETGVRLLLCRAFAGNSLWYNVRQLKVQCAGHL